MVDVDLGHLPPTPVLAGPEGLLGAELGDSALAHTQPGGGGIIDWEEACAGDHRFDLAAFAFDLDGADQQIWDRVELLIEAHLLRAYIAHLVLRRTPWAIRHHPEDVFRQLDRAERVLDRYDA